jgi:hypothetical protein
MYRMQEDEQFEADKPGYQLTMAHQNALIALVEAVDEMTDRINKPERPESRDENTPCQQGNDTTLAKID